MLKYLYLVFCPLSANLVLIHSQPLQGGESKSLFWPSLQSRRNLHVLSSNNKLKNQNIQNKRTPFRRFILTVRKLLMKGENLLRSMGIKGTGTPEQKKDIFKELKPFC